MMDYKYYEGTENLVVSFSTENYRLQKVGTDEIYDDAVDVVDHIGEDDKPRSRFTYVETEEKRESMED